jgi:hypothetical protein
MAVESCPACNRPNPRFLEECSKDARVNYYRCEACAHTWATSKKDDSIIRHVTPLLTKPKRKSA